MKPSLNVFFSIGRYFIPYFTVSVTSLIENNKDLDLNIFLIYDFDEVLLNPVIDFLNDRYQITLNLIFQDSESFRTYRIAEHVSLNTYLRLLLADIIPQEIAGGLFLDSDTVVTGSLKELANYDFKEPGSPALFAVMEIPEQNEFNSKRISDMGYQTDRYFNAGVLLVNLEKWRAGDMSKKLIEMASRYMDQLIFWDQDVLNMFFANNWGPLDSKYNALNLIWKRKKEPLIIHFAGGSKPWNYLNRHPYKACYFKYLKLTPFGGNRYNDFSIMKIPYKYYRDLRHLLNYCRRRVTGIQVPVAYHD